MNETKAGCREFLRVAAAVGITGALAGRMVAGRGQEQAGRLRKALQTGMLANDLSDADKFALARRCGFEGIEASSVIEDMAAARELGGPHARRS